MQRPAILAEPRSSDKHPFEMAVETNQSLSKISDSVLENFSDQTKTTIPVRERHRVQPEKLSDQFKKQLQIRAQEEIGKKSPLPPYNRREKSIDGQKQAPIMVLDINLTEGETSKIPVHKDDTPQSLAQTFCQKQKLPSSIQDKLSKLL